VRLHVRVAVGRDGEVVDRGNAGGEGRVGGNLSGAVLTLERGLERDVAAGAERGGALLVGNGPLLAGLAVGSAGAVSLGVGNPLPDVEPRARVTLGLAVRGAVEGAKVVGGVVAGEANELIDVTVAELVHKRRSLVLSVHVFGADVGSIVKVPTVVAVKDGEMVGGVWQ